ncbi:hypothetical protein L1987_00133 [Smallanthus sonchifolius]|uniref:Uncharacterized protein n=1 Tax=Smallanthus sonchifolius TaxID=185202 RepID=A0ACB9K1H6_9ASTR|nr:hypothetical protein L1987_00133 [Smallanthus sonchifolius]
MFFSLKMFYGYVYMVAVADTSFKPFFFLTDADHQPELCKLCPLGFFLTSNSINSTTIEVADSFSISKMSGYNRQGNRSAPAKSDSRIEHTNVDSGTDWKPKAVKIDGSLDSASCSQNYKSSVTGGSLVKNVASDVKNYNLIRISFDDDGNSKKVKQFGDKIQNDDDDSGRLNRPVFDICPKRLSSVINLKAPFHVLNKEKRNQSKQSMKGQNIMILGPGMVLMKGYISSVDQINIVRTCRELGISDGGFYQPGYSSGRKLHLQMMCLGKNWDPESHMYTELRRFDKAKPPEIPESFHNMVEKAIQDSNEFIRGNIGSSDERKVIPFMSPDVCIVNFFTKTGRLGLHQDKDESETSLKKGLPVVLFSIGDSAEFLYGETRSIDEVDKVTLESGDVLIFGGKSRLIYHGVPSIVPDSAPTSLMEATNMRAGRLNLTFKIDSLNNLKMSGYSREVNHGKSDCIIKLTNVGSRIKWKPMSVKIGGSLDSASCSQNDKGTGESLVKDMNVGARINWKPKAVKIDGYLDSASCSQYDKSSVTGGSPLKNVASDVQNYNLIPISFDDDGNSKKVKQFGDKSQNDDDDNGRLNRPVFDICPKRVTSVIKVKAPLHVMNKEKRNQYKQSIKGQNIIILGPGMVLLKGYISSVDQINIVRTCRELGISDGGFYQPGYTGGTNLHLQMMCLGKNWDPESHMYTELRPFDKAKPPRIPEKFHEMVKKAIQDSNEFTWGNTGGLNEPDVIPSTSPDICIVNFYTESGRHGLHQNTIYDIFYREEYYDKKWLPCNLQRGDVVVICIALAAGYVVWLAG